MHVLLKFSIENDQLFVSMNSMSDELRMIEGKVVEISKLQELFAENVLHQVSLCYSVSTYFSPSFHCDRLKQLKTLLIRLKNLRRIYQKEMNK